MPAEATPSDTPESKRQVKSQRVALEIEDCEDEIQAAERVVIDLKRERLALKKKMNRYSDPMSRLPLDARTQIFALVIDTQSSESDDKYPLPAPFVLGKVCTAWRSIVWNQPSLWKMIRIRFYQRGYSTQEELVREWLHRSQNCPLSFDIACPQNFTVPMSFVTMILTRANRWQSFKCTKMIHSLQDAMNQRPSISFPNLVSLEVNGYGAKSTRYKFLNVPRLRHLHFVGTQFSIVAPLHLLEDVIIDSNVELIASVADKLKSVQTLDLRLHESKTEPEYIYPITLPSLSSLLINGRHNDILRVLSILTVPELSNLELSFHQTPKNDKFWIEAIQDTLTRSSSNLTTLTIRNIDLREELALDFWENLPDLTSLSLEYQPCGKCDISDLTILRLATPGDDGSICLLPSLTHLDYKGKISFSSNTMIKTLQKRLALSKRKPGVQCLQKVNITYSNNQWESSGDHNKPNHWQTFFRNVTDLASHGIELNITGDEILLESTAPKYTAPKYTARAPSLSRCRIIPVSLSSSDASTDESQ